MQALSKISTTWSSLHLSFPPLPNRTDALLSLAVDDLVTESLENDGVTLQNMAASKYVQANGVFQGQVNEWQRKLGAVDAVLGLWIEAQRKWQVCFLRGFLIVRFLIKLFCI